MTVYLGIYNVFTDAGEAYVRQRDYVTDAINTYGTDNIGGITVGNEFMLKFVFFHSSFLSFFLYYLLFLYFEGSSVWKLYADTVPENFFLVGLPTKVLQMSIRLWETLERNY